MSARTYGHVMVVAGVPERAAGRPPRRLDRRRIDAERKVFEVIVSPEHDALPESEKAALAGMAPRTWRKYRTPELTHAALAARRAKYVRHLPAIDEALIKKAKEGSLGHILLAYERIEGWRPGLVAAKVEQSQAIRETWNLLSEEDRRAMADIFAKSLRTRHLRVPASS